MGLQLPHSRMKDKGGRLRYCRLRSSTGLAHTNTLLIVHFISARCAFLSKIAQSPIAYRATGLSISSLQRQNFLEELEELMMEC